MKRFALPLALPLLAGPGMAFAAVAAQPDAARLAMALRRLEVVGSVLYIAAHPDDENTRLLSYLANQLLLRTAYLSITRGDGGQNLIGTEQGDALGVIRSQELLAARRVDGAEQFFTRARDFGYSKTPEETLSIWDRDKVLADVVFAIRTFRPDVVITRFPTNGGGGHGHHTASAILAEEAFAKAGDPTAYPEQLKLVQPWKPKRLVYNVARFDPDSAKLIPQALAVDLGIYNPALGLSYGEMAAESRSNHKSQGFGAARQLGPLPDHFLNLLGEPFKESLFDGVDATWARLPGTEKLRAALQKAKKSYAIEAPHLAVPALVEARAALSALPASPWRAYKLAEIDGVIVAALGLVLDARAAEYSVAAGDAVKITASAVTRAPIKVRLASVQWPTGQGAEAWTKGENLENNKPFSIDGEVKVSSDAQPSAPYWLLEDGSPGLYAVADQKLIGRPENAGALTVRFDLEIEGAKLQLERPVEFVWTDPVDGERRRSLEITPRLMVNTERPVLMLPDDKGQQLALRFTAGTNALEGTVTFELPAGYRVEPASVPFKFAKKGDEATVAVKVLPDPKVRQRSPGALKILVSGQPGPARGLWRINHPHIPIQTLFPKAEVKLSPVTLAKGVQKLGYIRGAGDLVAESLRQVGYSVTELDDAALTEGNLAGFDAIVIGVRAYNVNERLPLHQERLMAYVAGGGTLLAQYNTQNWVSSVKAQLGPHPFTISRARVTDERAAMVRKPHAVWTKPNAITDADFEGWVQERGLYFAESVDGKYETPLACNDPGEKPHEGGLLIARHGKGTFIYTGLAFFRQLPAGVPGAYRLFANLISHGRR